MYDIMMYLWYSHRPVQEEDNCYSLDFSLPEYEETISAAVAATDSLSSPEEGVLIPCPEIAGASTNAEQPKSLLENIDVYVSVQY